VIAPAKEKVMNNIIAKVSAPEVRKLVEEHLNKNLATNKRARVRDIQANFSGEPEPGQPTLGLMATFDVLEV
jgi:hypothetical protein